MRPVLGNSSSPSGGPPPALSVQYGASGPASQAVHARKQRRVKDLRHGRQGLRL